MYSRYNEYFKTTYDSLINVANNWLFDECEMGIPLYGINGQIVGAAQKKTKRRSEMQLAVSEVTGLTHEHEMDVLTFKLIWTFILDV